MIQQMYYIYVIYFMILYVVGIPLYRSQYRCTRDGFDYYQKIRIFPPEKFNWSKLPDHVNTCTVPYYMSYCISKTFMYSYRLPMLPNHYHTIVRNIHGIAQGSYKSIPTHPNVLFDLLCLPKVSSTGNKKYKYTKRYHSVSHKRTNYGKDTDL
jgi:hypothetical protein